MEDLQVLNIDKYASQGEQSELRGTKTDQGKIYNADDAMMLRHIQQNEKKLISSNQINLLIAMHATGILPRKYFKIKLSRTFRDNEDPLNEEQFSIDRLIHRYIDIFDISGMEEALKYWQNKIIKFVQANRNTPIYQEIIIQPLKLVEQQWGAVLQYAKSLNLSSLDEGLIDRVRDKLKKTEEEAAPKEAGEMALRKATGMYIINGRDIFADDVLYQPAPGQGVSFITKGTGSMKPSTDGYPDGYFDFANYLSGISEGLGMVGAFTIMNEWQLAGNELRNGMKDFLKVYIAAYPNGKFIQAAKDLLNGSYLPEGDAKQVTKRTMPNRAGSIETEPPTGDDSIKKALLKSCACGCGKQFETDRPNKKYFSKECGNRARQNKHQKEQDLKYVHSSLKITP
jgi:hypothetical protein